MSNKYVAYYRVSTTKQGVSGLGLDAQKNDVANYIKGNSLLGEFTDIVSGKKNNRPQLLAALELCKKENAILVIAKLDRLSRNLTFISTLMDNKVKFVCCDMPDANEMTIHIFGSLAQWERKRISERTKAALAALKRKGVKLGKPENLTHTAKQAGIAAIKEKANKNQNNSQAKLVIGLLHSKGNTLTSIATQLNSAGMKTSTGKEFKPESVRRLIPKVTL